MATEDVSLIIPFGPMYTGKASSVVYTISDNAEDIVIGPITGTGVTETLAGTGSFLLRLPIDPSWIPCTAAFSIQGQAGVGIQGTITFADMPMSVFVAAVLTDNAPENQAVPGSLGAVTKKSTGVFATGTITDASPSTRGFVITLDEGQTLPGDDRYVGLGLWFDGDPSTTLAPGKNKITGYDVRTADTAYISFQRPWSGLPTNGSSFSIG